ncbi:MAG: Mur ligase domain-containing protein [Kiritimatiellaeota bacterium]|nr:Mur ligase domain-containing protein [Kiritimatiellota bacterium]
MSHQPMTVGHFHLAGIAGVGMSALAQALINAGHSVTGSDRFLDQGRENLGVLETLRRAGAKLFPQDGSGVTAQTTAVVISTAIEADNPDLTAAQKFGVPVRHRSELLAELVAGKKLLAIAGTAGKTTTTALVGHLLVELGADPSVVNGGVVLGWQRPDALGSARKGRDDLWVLETDESDRSLLRFAPDWAIITNISKDHFELNEVVALFRKFAGQVKTGIICGPGVAELIRGHTTAILHSPSALNHYPCSLPGRHNAENVALAAALCEQLGYAPEKIRVALTNFRGIHRRLEKAGEREGITVFDDYAHNPAKIAAACAAVQPERGRLFAVWRPHGFGPLKLMLGELTDALAGVLRPQDHVLLLPVFYAGGTTSSALNSDALVDALVARGVAAQLAPDYATLEARLRAVLRPGDVVLVMGARDPDLPLFARRLAAG